MSDFLTRLVERTQGVAQVAQPIIPPMFAPESTTLSDYSQHPRLDSEPLNALNRAMVTPPPNDSSSATLNQSFRKTSDTRFAPPRHIESDLSEQVEAVLPQPVNGLIEHGTIKHSSSPATPKDLTNSKRQKGNFFGNNESPTNKTVSEYDQNASQLPEQSLGAKSGVSGRLIDSDQLSVPQNLPDAERNQNIGTQLKQHLPNEKRDASGGSIKSGNASVLQEMAEVEGDQVAPEGAIDSDRASALREVTEPTEAQSAETSYLKPQSPGKIRFPQATVMELPEQSLGAKSGVSGRLIDSDQLSVPQNLPDAERNQNIGTQLKQHLPNEKRDASGGSIKSGNASVLQEMAEVEGDQVAPEGAIDSDRASALREVTEPTEAQSAETSYLKPQSPGKIRFLQATEMKPSSAEPTIKVTIGRVEVRAVMPSVPIATASHARTQSPTLSLDDYLKRRNERQR